MIYNDTTGELVPTEPGELCQSCGDPVGELIALVSEASQGFAVLYCERCETIWNLRLLDEPDYLQEPPDLS